MSHAFKMIGPVAMMVLFAAGCGANTSSGSAAGGDESDIVGVEDLETLEAELGMVHDTKLPNGQWTRDPSKGGCWARQQAASPHLEFRRYTNGAAFFAKKGTAPATGDSRPVVCMDVDTPDGSFTLEPSVIDATIRFHLGHVAGPDDAAGGWSGVAFDHGGIAGHSGSFSCGAAYDFTTAKPGPDAEGTGAAAYQSCKQSGGNEQDCTGKAYEACAKVAEATSQFAGFDIEQLEANDYNTFIDWSVVVAVFNRATRMGLATDVYNMTTDPIGKFVASTPAGADGFTHYRFEKLDVHARNGEIVFTPKNSDQNVLGAAIP